MIFGGDDCDWSVAITLGTIPLCYEMVVNEASELSLHKTRCSIINTMFYIYFRFYRITYEKYTTGGSGCPIIYNVNNDMDREWEELNENI